MIIEIKGVEFSNKGAELMLHSIIQVLDQQLDDYELVLTPGHLLPYQKRARLGAWQKFSFKQFGLDWTSLGNLAPAPVRRLLRHFGIVVEKEIDLILDASGFVYSDKWGSHRLLETAKLLKRIGKHNTRYIFLPQAFGPFKNSKNAALMTQLIGKAEWAIARDEDSYQSLKALGDSKKISCYPDFTPLLDTSNVVLPLDLPKQFVCIIPNNKMYAHQDLALETRYMAFLKNAVLSVEALGLTPVVLNHEGEKDRKLCLRLLESLPDDNKPLFINGLEAAQVKKVIGKSVFNLTSRFHGCVSSLSQGVPALATSWSHKYEQLYRYYQCEDDLIDINQTQEQLQHKMAQLLDNHTELSAQLDKRAQAHKATISQMWTEIFDRVF